MPRHSFNEHACPSVMYSVNKNNRKSLVYRILRSTLHDIINKHLSDGMKISDNKLCV